MSEKKYSALRVAILGSTGSIGTQALDVVRELGCRVVFLSAHSNSDLLFRQAAEFSPDNVCLTSEKAYGVLKTPTELKSKLFIGEKAHLDLIRDTEADVIVHAISGLDGLPAAYCASEKGARLAIANKEAIIAAGDLIFGNVRKNGGELIPVDSEHSAIFQCLLANRGKKDQIKRLILTASGGPFFGCGKDELRSVTPERALAHPTWKMGPKITVDCATMMNKGFEIIEAVRLFGIDEKRVDVLIHRQSIIHSMVEYIDNSVIAQLGEPDMRSPIRFALTYPDRAPATGESLNFIKVGKLTFDKPDTSVFPLLDTAREAIRAGGTSPVSLIAADEEAVSAFLKGKLPFDRIADVVRETLSSVTVYKEVSPDSIDGAVLESRIRAREIISK